ncbi:hypothetical protein UF75_3386 [Desulfosporosinus sp. I2]|uniref:hypothetical protein n=1 Tax=Desulfosporosinus sp. I2 TaxID=1617025 RepID=UPI0005EFD2F1|nr:hypothetical protein [Desulfosporosinus sp. I2]KJR46237.1 hypothetical protein UF75_3386 [Desulfosporosinus sp. I2]
MKTKAKLLLIMVLLLLSLSINYISPNVAWAESGSLKATNFQVDVKPEYDDPRTLVIYQGDFINPGTETIKKDTLISFIIPKGAEIGMACEITAQGGHDCQPYTTQDLGDNKVKLSWKITKDIAPNQKYPAYLEFYYDNGSAAPNKTFNYIFFPTDDLDNLDLNIVAPKNASNFVTTPAASMTGKDSNGLDLFSFNYKNQTPKDNVAVKVDYTKSDNKPSFDKPQIGDNNPISSSTGWNSQLSKPEFLIPILLFVAILTGILIFGLNRNKRPARGAYKGPESKKKGPTSKKPGGEQAGTQEKRKLRQMLLDGKIDVDTYKQLLSEIKEDN